MTTSCATIARWRKSTLSPRLLICAISIARKERLEDGRRAQSSARADFQRYRSQRARRDEYAVAALLGVDRVLLHPGRNRGRALGATNLLGPWSHGTSSAGDVGNLHHELCLLGRNCAFGNAHFCNSVFVPHQVADRGLSSRRDDDYLRGRNRRPVSADPSWPRLVFLLAAALSERALPATRFPLAAGVGRIRGSHLSNRQCAVLVDGTDSRYRKRSRGRSRRAQKNLHRARDGMAGHRPPMASLLDGVPADGRARDAARGVGSLGRVM